jgi:hypothetical protein
MPLDALSPFDVQLGGDLHFAIFNLRVVEVVLGGERSHILFRDGGAIVLEIPLISTENAASSQLVPVDVDEDDNAKRVLHLMGPVSSYRHALERSLAA